MRLHTDRLLLRSYTYDDLNDYHAINSDPRLLVYELHEPFERKESEEALLSWINATKHFENKFGYFEMAIEERVQKDVIGLVSLNFRDIGEQVLEIGIRIKFDCQNQGFATEALNAVFVEALTNTDVHRIFACSDARNVASVRVFEKLGMKREGVLRQHIRLPNDTYADEVIYGLLKKDWKKKEL